MFDFNIINCNTSLGESSFYLFKTNEIIWLDLDKTYLFSINIKNNKLRKTKINLPGPLGNIYPLSSNKFVISCKNGLFIYTRKTKNLIKYKDIRGENELNTISYNDGSISKNKLWISLSHIKETKKLGYFGYLQNSKFYEVDKKFKVSNGPAIDEKNKLIFFSDSFNRVIYQYDLNNLNKKIFYKFTKNEGFPDGLAIDSQKGLWVAHWGGSRISRIKYSGKLDFNYFLPAKNITSLAFFGKNLNYIFVTTAKIGIKKNLLYKYKYSGSAFIIKTNFKGLKIPYAQIKI